MKMISARAAARSAPGSQSPDAILRDVLFKLPSGSEMSRDFENIQRIRDGTAQGGKRPEDMSPQELHAVLWQVLTFRDSSEHSVFMEVVVDTYTLQTVVKTIEQTIGGLLCSIDFVLNNLYFFAERIPGLQYLVEKTNEAISGRVIAHPLDTSTHKFLVFVYTTLEVLCNFTNLFDQ
jgi:hypothetical protein